jgi:prepilin-type N-terminal cleavage/methylation domain-containing protein
MNSHYKSIDKPPQVRMHGFTIVELLIVIVIIGILAALVTVAYTGITARANSTRAKTNATALQKKIEAWAADGTAGTGSGTGNYPQLLSLVNSMSGSAVKPAGVTIVRVDPTSVNGTATVGFKTCDSGTGYQVTWWDFATNALGTPVTGGTQVSCAYPAS